MSLDNRVKKLEETHRGPAIWATWKQERPDVYGFGGKEYPSLEAIEAAYPGREVHCIQVIHTDKPTDPKTGEVVSWAEFKRRNPDVIVVSYPEGGEDE